MGNDVSAVCDKLQELIEPLLEDCRSDMSACMARMDVLERQYVEYLNPTLRHIDEAIGRHERMISRLRARREIDSTS